MTSSVTFAGPLFLVGMPRSGTKLLRDLLNRHPRVRIPDAETEFLPWLVRYVEVHGAISTRAAFDRLFAKLRDRSYFTYMAASGKPVDPGAWFAAARSHDAAGLFEALIRLGTGASSDSGVIWGDKSPSYMNDLPLIRRLYPNARVLHIARDARDHCMSMRDAWGKDVLRAAQRWSDGVQQARRDASAWGSDYMETRYEDLIASPETTMRRVCAFAGLDFLDQMLTLARPSENLGATRGQTRVVAENLGKFREGLSPATLDAVEAVAGEALEAFGYRLELPKRQPRRVPRVRMLVGQVRDAMALVKHRSRTDGWFEALRFHLRYYTTTRG